MLVYPVKGGRAIARPQAVVEARGLQHDRRLMIVDPRGDFVSQRECARLRDLESSYPESTTVGSQTGVSMMLRAPGQEPLSLHLGEGPRRIVTVWGDRVEAIDVGDDAAGWLSHWLSRPVRLALMPPDATRHIDPDFAVSPGEIVSFADGFPVLLVSQSSVEALGQRMKDRGATPVPNNRFRANLVVIDAPAFAEDAWTHVTIGDVKFRVAKPCARCVVTTIAQDASDPTALPSKEPLSTLSTFRSRPGGVMFGQNLVPTTTGTVRVGDLVAPAPS